jgi:hypothetical protein
MKYLKIAIILIALGYIIVLLRYFEYGTSYNKVRSSLQIPTIESHWSRDISFNLNEINYNNNRDSSNSPHIKKRIVLDRLGRIINEADLFIIKDQSITIDVVYTYTTQNHWHISYYKTDQNYHAVLSRKQLADTLSKYKF